MSKINDRLKAFIGARKVLTECLAMKPGDTLAVVWDETTADVFEVLSAVSLDLGLDVRERKVDLAYQAAFGKMQKSRLDIEIREAFQSSRGILTCVSDFIDGGAFRHALVKEGADRGRRLGHIPGATLELLAHAVNIDYGPVVQRCDDLALILTLGRIAELFTYELDKTGQPTKEHVLKLDLDTLERSPITSTGVIAMDTWGNLPGGETFIAPIEDRAEGTFVLNAALKNHVLTPPSRVLLSFERGRLCTIEGDAEPRAAVQAFVDFAKSKGDLNYSNLAELGIGVNDGIKTLTGNALFDEKCAGTVHIAIGANDGFGGKYTSVIHEDFISRDPTLLVDGQPILKSGKLVYDQSYWRETLEKPFLRQSFSDSTSLRRTLVIHGEVGANETLRVRRDVAAGRVCQYTLGELETSRILRDLYALLPTAGLLLSVREFVKKSGLDRSRAEAAISILLRHGLVGVN